MAEGLLIKLSEIPGLTVDGNGKRLLTSPFVFQCPPMNEFKVTRQYTFGNYDTIYDGQYTRRGSLQLKVWSFDTLAMYLGVNADNPHRHEPRWVPFANYDGKTFMQWQGQTIGVNRPTTPEWYARQLANLHFSGAPFKFSASWAATKSDFSLDGASIEPVILTNATLLQYDEDYKAGEGDAIYFEGCSFQEWKDPTIKQSGLGKPKGATHLPAWVNLYPTGACRDSAGQRIPKSGDCTLADLARHFYGEPSDWRLIARANHLTGGAANTKLIDFPRLRFPAHSRKPRSRRLTIPARPHHKHQSTHTKAYRPTRQGQGGGVGL